MPTYTNHQLQLALAKMLPEKLIIHKLGGEWETVFWKNKPIGSGEVQETEWLHVCWLIEQTLSDYSGSEGQELSQHDDYALALLNIVGVHKPTHWGEECVADFFLITNTSWQQRALALCKVKGVEV